MKNKDTDRNFYLAKATGNARSAYFDLVCKRFDIPIYAQVLLVGFGHEGRQMISRELGCLVQTRKLAGNDTSFFQESGYSYVVSDVADIPSPSTSDERFDYVVVIKVLDNIEKAYREPLMRRLGDLVKSGGQMAVVFSPKAHTRRRSGVVRHGAVAEFSDDVEHMLVSRRDYRLTRLPINAFERLVKNLGLTIVRREMRNSHPDDPSRSVRIVFPFDRLPILRTFYTTTVGYLLQHR